MKIEGPLYDAIFLERPNRFLTLVEINGKVIESHLPDPGRLKELLIRGVRLRVRKVPESVKHRRTMWTTVMVRSGEQYISLDTNLPNKLVKQMLEKKELPFLKDWNLKKAEVKVGNHRFDFLLEKKNSEFFLEVKSVTLVENGVAMFPDAVTERGKKHMEELSKLKESGSGARYHRWCRGGIRLHCARKRRAGRWRRSGGEFLRSVLFFWLAVRL